MAEKDGNKDSWNLWGWVDSIKKTGEQIITIYSEDLKEFGTSLKKDTEEAVKKGSEALKTNLLLDKEKEEEAKENKMCFFQKKKDY